MKIVSRKKIPKKRERERARERKNDQEVDRRGENTLHLVEKLNQNFFSPIAVFTENYSAELHYKFREQIISTRHRELENL